MAKVPQVPPDGPVSGAPLPDVQIEVRQGGGRTHRYDLANLEFLIGAVPGCDLRLPGIDLPPLFCLLTRHPQGLRLRKMAPTQALLVNGETVQQTELADGDRITLGATDIHIHLSWANSSAPTHSGAPELQDQVLKFRQQVLRFHQEQEAFAEKRKRDRQEWEEKARRLDEEQRSLLTAKARLEALPKAPAEPSRPAPVSLPLDLAPKEKALEARAADVLRQQQELAGVRQELADLRNQLYQRYQERRDRLSGLQEAVDWGARKVQEQKRQLEAERKEWSQAQEVFAQRQALQEQRGREVEQGRQRLEQDRQAWLESQKLLKEELAQREQELNSGQAELAQRGSDMEARARQYQADLLRLDRLQGSLAEREQALATKEKFLEEERGRIEQSSTELESQVVELDQWRHKLQEENDQARKQQEENEALGRALDQRAASLEGQQAALATLRTRLERLKEEMRAREQQIEEERGQQEQVVAEVEEKHKTLADRKTELERERELFTGQREEWVRRSATLETAVRHMRQAQEQIEQQQKEGQEKDEQLAQRQSTLHEQEALLQGRLDQIAQTQERLDVERAALRERTQALAQSELARESLQESLRKRSEELTRRQEVLDAQADDLEAQVKLLQEGRKEQEEQLAQDRRKLEVDKQTLQGELDAWAKEKADFQDRAQHHLRQFEQLQELGRQLAAQRKALAEERAETLRQKVELEAARDRIGQEEAELRRQVQELTRQLPEIELRAGTSADRLAQAREELRDHLNEVHEFVRTSRRDLEELGERLAEEERGLRLEEQGLRQGQEEHRLALANFRQQLLGWQGQIGAMKLMLAQDQSRLHLRQAEVEEQARQVDQTSAQLAQKAQELQHGEVRLEGRRQEVDGHLHDMRAWYRQKMRELAGVELEASPPSESALEEEILAQDITVVGEGEEGIIPVGANILSLSEPADRRLGEVLQELQLVDRPALTALLAEARRQRRSLRQVLLKSGAVTLYQLALIEAGNVAGLMLGPVRLVDRLAVLSHETLYRVFDPRRGQEGLLRHLAEKDAQDSVLPDEYRQRFRAALAVENPHVVGTWEVLDIAERPAVLQEWVVGLPSGDWPPLAAAPGVCYRLLTQAGLALATAHRAGIVHGHLHEGSFLLTPDGTLKVLGLGEPSWLWGKNEEEGVEFQNDLRSLGKVASGWCSPTGVRRGAKAKPLPEALISVLYRLNADGEGYESADALLEDLDRAGADLPANGEAWDRLLKYVGEHATADVFLRKSA